MRHRSRSAADADLAALIRNGDRDAALAAVRAGADVNVAQGDGTTPLHWAVYKVDPELTRELLKHGANPNAKSSLGATPLAEAAKLANAELVQLLIKARADVNEANEDGQTPLMLAARTGSVPVADLLVRAGANVNAKESWREQTALMWAAGSGQADMTAYLIKHGADVEARAAANDWRNQVTSEPRAQYRPTGGLTPLLYAIRAGCMPCVQVHAQGGRGYPASHAGWRLAVDVGHRQPAIRRWPTSCWTRAPIRMWPTGGDARRCTSPWTCVRSATAS